MTFTTGDPDGLYPSTSVRNQGLEPVVIPATPDKQDVALGHADLTTAPVREPSLYAVIDHALETAPVDHWVTYAAADELVRHIEKAILDATGGPHHLVHVECYGWSLTHPLTERFEGRPLHQCPIIPLVGENPPDEDGTYEVWLARGELRWEPVAPPNQG